MVNVKTLLIVVFLSLFVSFTGQASVTKLQASIDRNPVMEREPFVLKIEANGSVNTNDLDLSLLNKTTFRVGRTATGSQTQLINGSSSRSTTWSVVLVADSAGKHIIPPFEINGVKSEPITVEVVKASQQGTSRNESIYIENTIQPQKVYVQQSIKLTTKLFISPQVELQSGRLSEPSLEDAIIKQHGKDKDATEIINGIRYRVIERVYTITPQSSGNFKIQSPRFDGDVTNRNRRRSNLSSFIQSKPVTAEGQSYDVEVLPIPSDYQGSWLPSDLVQLNEEWQPNTDTVEVGEPITRTFTLTALNVSEEQLPEIETNYPDGFNVYPDKSETHSVVRNNALVSQRVSSEAIVANQPGTYTLPEITVNWFNAKIRRQQTATLPAKTIKVVPSSSGLGAVVAPQSQSIQNNDDCECAESSEHSLDVNQLNSNVQASNGINIGSFHLSKLSLIVLIVAGWLGFVVTLILYIKRIKQSKKTAHTTSKSGQAQQDSHFDMQDLKRACLSHQPHQAHSLLVQWAKAHKPEVKNFNQFQQYISAELREAILELERFKYSPQSTENSASWNGEKLWAAIEMERKVQSKARNKPSSLPPLNPS